MLQHIKKKLQAYKTKNTCCISDIAQKSCQYRLTNNFPFKYRHRKKITAWKTECEHKRVAG